MNTSMRAGRLALGVWFVGVLACSSESSKATQPVADAAPEASTPEASASSLTVQTFTSSGSGSIDIQVNSHIVMGPNEALLVDGQLLVADASSVVDLITKSGRTLKTVFLTHAHPDHYAGFQVIQSAFPNAAFVTTAEVLGDFQASAAGTLAYLGSSLGNLVASSVVTPTALAGDTLTLDGQSLQVIEMPNKGESAHAGAIGLPGGALLSGDLVYHDVHLYLGECNYAGWKENLAALQAMGFTTFYPGHGPSPVDATILAADEAYIAGAIPILQGAEATDAGSQDAGDPRVAAAIGKLQAAFPDFQSQYLVGFSASQFIDANHCQ
jgi:glyoxylase-like metal-dependent hydrolase (beta-lactamase superfamily II)